MTWNLGGLDDEFVDERVEAACFEAVIGVPLQVAMLHPNTQRPPPDIIVFQEVTARARAAHLSRHLSAAGYQQIATNTGGRSYFELICFRAATVTGEPLETPLADSEFGRILGGARLGFDDGEISVFTGHFDSGPQGGPIRIAQTRQVFAEMTRPVDPRRGVTEPSLFAGDTNMRVNEWKRLRTEAASVGVRDAWIECGRRPENQWTWKRDQRRARFDRVWAAGNITFSKFELLGTDPIAGLTCPETGNSVTPSDHAGIRVEFEAASAALTC